MCIQGSRSISLRSSFALADSDGPGHESSLCVKSLSACHICKIILNTFLICRITGDDFYFVMIILNDLLT